MVVDTDYSADRQESNRYRFGMDCRSASPWSIRAGYFYDASPAPDKAVSFSNIACVDRQNVSAGLGRRWSCGWRVDGLYQFSWGDRTVEDAAYRHRIHAFGCSVSCSF
jgi:long-subunit fatty acid transport protein